MWRLYVALGRHGRGRLGASIAASSSPSVGQKVVPRALLVRYTSDVPWMHTLARTAV